MAAISETTGASLWTWTPGSGSIGQIIAADNLLFVTDANGTTYAISLATHQTLWSIAQFGVIAVADNALFIAGGTPGTVTAIGLMPVSADPAVVRYSPAGLQSAAPTSVDFDFPVPMDSTSFSVASDVDAFSGPGGADLRSTITGYAWLNNNMTLQVDFTPPTQQGPYTMIIGP